MWKTTSVAASLAVLSFASFETAVAVPVQPDNASICWTKCGGQPSLFVNPQPLPPRRLPTSM